MVHQNEVTFLGGISGRRPKSELLFLLGSFVFVWLYLLGKDGGRKGGTKREGASCRELPEDQVISCCATSQVPGGGWEMEEGR